MEKIIILNHDPLSKRISNGFCIDYLIEHGYVVEYWDLSSFYYPGIVVNNTIDCNYVTRFYDLDSILESINKEPITTIFVVEAAFLWKSRKVYKLLSDKSYKTVKISLYGNNCLDNTFISKLKSSLDTISVLPSRLLLNLYKRYFSIKGNDLFFTSVERNITSHKVIRINHPDYEEFRRSQLKYDRSYNNIVFLDEYFPFHPEIKYWLKLDLDNLASDYYEQMKRLFDYLERVEEKKVIIAAHPKSKYLGQEFGDREIVIGRTSELIRNASLVVMHMSTSISYALLNNTQLLLVTTPEYEKLPKSMKEFRNSLNKYLDVNTQMIDSSTDMSSIIYDKVKSEIREKYINNFLTSSYTENNNNKDIILQALKKL